MNKYLHILIIIMVAGWCSVSWAQQKVQYSLNFLNKYNFNPAYAGMDESLSATGVYRQQWVGLDGSPASQNLNIHAPLYFLGGGIGINFDNETIGAQNALNLTLSYNYFLRLGEKTTLSLGLGGGIVQRSLDGDKLRTSSGEYEENNLIHNDNLLPNARVSGIASTILAGAYLRAGRFEFGVGANHLNRPSVEMETVTFNYESNFFINSSYYFILGEHFQLTPTVFVKSDLIETQGELALMLSYDKNFFGGAGIRGYNANTLDAIVIFAGIRLNESFTLAYGYDATISGLNQVSTGSHEIMVNYNLNKPIGKGKLPKIIYNPRNL